MTRAPRRGRGDRRAGRRRRRSRTRSSRWSGAGGSSTRVDNVFFAMTGANTNDTLQEIAEARRAEARRAPRRHLPRPEALRAREGRLRPPRRPRPRREVPRPSATTSTSCAPAPSSPTPTRRSSARSTRRSRRSAPTSRRSSSPRRRRARSSSIDEAELAGAERGRSRRRGGGGQGAQARRQVGPRAAEHDPAAGAGVARRTAATRERLFRASTERAEHGDANDTRALILRLAALRAHGRRSSSGTRRGPRTSSTTRWRRRPRRRSSCSPTWPRRPSRRRNGEAARMQALVDAKKGGFKLAPWDWQYYAEQVRKAEYALDDAAGQAVLRARSRAA